MSGALIITIILNPVILFLLYKYLKGGVNKIKHDMKNKIIIITGASSGLGEYTALDLLDSNATVIFACRNEEKAKKAIDKIADAKIKKNAKFMKLDLCSFKSIEEFVSKIKKEYKKIDILMNNAGAAGTSFKKTEDGYDSFLQGNYLGSVYLTLLLLDHMNSEEAKIINLSSMGHYYSDLKKGDVSYYEDMDKFKEKFYINIYSNWNLYFTSKLLVIYFTQYLAEFCEKKYKYVKVACVHPGLIVGTFFNYFRENFKLFKIIEKITTPLIKFFTKNTKEGAQTQLYLCYEKNSEIYNGRYYSDCHPSLTSTKAQNKEIQNEFISWTIKEMQKLNKDNEIIKSLEIPQ